MSDTSSDLTGHNVECEFRRGFPCSCHKPPPANQAEKGPYRVVEEGVGRIKPFYIVRPDGTKFFASDGGYEAEKMCDELNAATLAERKACGEIREADCKAMCFRCDPARRHQYSDAYFDENHKAWKHRVCYEGDWSKVTDDCIADPIRRLGSQP